MDVVYEDTCFDTACDALDRLAIAIGYRKALPVCFRLMENFLQNPDWHYRHAAFWTLSQVGEVMQDDDLEAQINNAVKYFADPHPRVRYAAINAIGQLSRDFAPSIQMAMPNTIVPALVSALSDPSQRVQAHSAAALINFTTHQQFAVCAVFSPS
jgi:HEAT repeat protein